MAAAQLMLPANRAFNSNGLPIAGAVAKLYVTGTTTPANFYADSALTVSLGSSLTANAAGRFDPLPYQDKTIPFRWRLETPAGVELDDIDPFYFGAVYGSVLGTAGTVAATRADLAAMLGSADTAVYLAESGREGPFVFDTSDLSDEVTADPTQIAYVATAIDDTGESGAWVRKTDRLTPKMAGCVPYDPADETWTHVALQALFDVFRNPNIARRYVCDWAGEWGIADKLYATYWDGGEPNVERRFIAGTLRVAPLASLPGGVALDAALEIAGYRMNWQGVCGVHPSGASQYYTAYSTRRYRTGVRRRMCTMSSFGDFYVDDAIREGVWDDSRSSSGFTLRAGTAYETVFPNANNIGMRTGKVSGRTCGSNYLTNKSATAQTVSLKEQGGNSSGAGAYGAEVWDATPASYGGLSSQRTRLTVASTADLEALDFVWTRLELAPAIYGTIAADSGTKTITWTTGDPTTYLAVGDVYPYFQGGPNAAVEFRIVSFGGTSNRTITVDRAPATHAATADAGYSQLGAADWHVVSMVQDATHVLVYPWVPDRNNSALYIVNGAVLRVNGSDQANTRYDSVLAHISGCGYMGQQGYAGSIGTFLAESCEVGLNIGQVNDQHLGFVVEHGHLEANRSDVLAPSGLASGTINIQSAIDLAKVHGGGVRPTTNAQALTDNALGTFQLMLNGQLYTSQSIPPYESTAFWMDFYGISNAPHLREQFLHKDDPTLTVTYDRNASRLFARHHWARIVWTDDDGSSPDGTLTLNMDATLTAQGWTFGGAGSGASYVLATPGASSELDLSYLLASKKVAITRRVCYTGTGDILTADEVYDATAWNGSLEVPTKNAVRDKLEGALTPTSTTIGGGTTLTKVVAYAPSLTPASVAAATIAEETFAVAGLTTADKVIVNPPAIANATGIAGARVSAADTLAIRFANPTAGALTPSSGTYTVMAFRS